MKRFSEFFESWLFENYYKNGVRIGKSGDFFTSVSVGSFFGICIAKKILSLNLEKGTKIIEIGSNDGYLICDIIQGIFTFDKDRLNDFEFCVVEPFEVLRKIQKNKFYERFGNEINIKHYKSLDEISEESIFFISNEIFDCLKPEIINGDKMLFMENFQPKFDKILPEVLKLSKKYGVKKGEIPLGLNEFISKIYKSSKKFYFLTFDYGFENSCNDFTIRIFKNHNVYSFFEIDKMADFYGVSDITYSVNFGILRDEFLSFEGVKMDKFMKQNRAILEFGGSEILEMFLKFSDKNGYKNALMQFKRLVFELGEKFYMISFTKGYL
ncbi:dihydrodipicolinate reductase [Campylobacter sp. FMV-PI01]|uniref:Dihydrodipicolinate reductase n=1 Tax=Campylobacter portucalensis TaxID=2608384 RepID=A0A6L5WII2_9BACT|nr:SAM-dependent methyltransferase [Campylobacter portucalensis]MSN97098.1 dihydrodipicolinate reductase [Campylobacter portucalensis]